MRVNLHGPRLGMAGSRVTMAVDLSALRLDIEIPAELGGGSLLEALVPYSFPAYARVPRCSHRITFGVGTTVSTVCLNRIEP